jgi:hypothetical protein
MSFSIGKRLRASSIVSLRQACMNLRAGVVQGTTTGHQPADPSQLARAAA